MAKRMKLTAKQKRNLAIAGAVGLGLFLWSRRGAAGSGVDVVTEMDPVEVQGGETVSVETYRVIGARRPGMQYFPIESGGVGSAIQFSPGASGMFTRNFVQEGNQLWAEVKA